jgi:hypothetical protein
VVLLILNGKELPMNVFYLDKNPRKSAEYHCDAHVRKMLVEYAQLMSVAHWTSTHEEDIERAIDNKLYKPTHIKHPSTKWTKHSIHSYSYVFCMWEELCLIYVDRYGKEHGSSRLREGLINLPRELLKNTVKTNYKIAKDMAPPPMCFGREYQHIAKQFNQTKHNEVVDAYREYYRQAKKNFATWGKGRSMPRWWLRVA